MSLRYSMRIVDDFGEPPTAEQREKLVQWYRATLSLSRKPKNVCVTSFRIPAEEFSKAYDFSHYILTGNKPFEEKQQ